MKTGTVALIFHFWDWITLEVMQKHNLGNSGSGLWENCNPNLDIGNSDSNCTSVRLDLHGNSGYTLWQLQIHASRKITLDPHFSNSGSVL